jgi:DNA-binding MarR family transcriptional regulator
MRDQFRGDGIVLENALAFWVNRFYQSARREMYRAFQAQGYDLTPEQWMVLVRLAERDGRTQSELCDVTTRDPSTMSRILDSMVVRGLLCRAVDPADRRHRIIVLTPDGRAAWKTLRPVAEELVGRLEAAIPDADLETTRRTLQRMCANVDL